MTTPVQLRKMFLYHKISPLGLNYLGSTVNKEPHKYKGSGKVWRKHLQDNFLSASKLKTIILFETTDKHELRKQGEYYSVLFNVVDSPEWANLIPETGQGCFKSVLSEEHRKKISDTLRLRVVSDETKERRSKAMRGRTHTDQTKKKISQAKTGKPGHMHTQQTREMLSKQRTGRKKPGIIVVHKQTQETFSSIRDAAKKFSINETTLANKLRARNAEYDFCYKDEAYITVPKPGQKGRKFTAEQCKCMKENNGMARRVKNKLTGEIFPSIMEAAQSVRMKQNTLTAQLKHKRKCQFIYHE